MNHATLGESVAAMASLFLFLASVFFLFFLRKKRRRKTHSLFPNLEKKLFSTDDLHDAPPDGDHPSAAGPADAGVLAAEVAGPFQRSVHR